MHDPDIRFIALWMLIKILFPPVIGGYLLGSIPFGLVLTKLAGMGDIRAIGSGNIGATNVLRTGRKGLAVLTLLLDGGKGFVAVIAAAMLYPTWNMIFGDGVSDERDVVIWSCIAGLFAVLGHIFPLWLRFKGGKGVATAIGVFTALSWPVGVACMVTWLLVAVVSRISSLAALVAMALAPLYAYLWMDETVAMLASIVALLVIAKHYANIRRLLKGEEPRIGRPA